MSKRVKCESLEQMDEIIGQYYKKMGVSDYFGRTDKNKKGIFYNFCKDDLGAKFDQFDGEFAQGVEDCMLCDFDDTFPLTEKEERDRQIFDILKYIYQNGKLPDSSEKSMYLDLNELRTDVDANDMKLAKALYKEQCAFLGELGFNDDSLFKLLTVGHKIGKESILMHLADSFNRDRLNSKLGGFNEKYEFERWFDGNSLLRDLRNKSHSKAESIKNALKSYFVRIMKPVLFNNNTIINESLRDISMRIVSISSFIDLLLNKHNVTPPFHIDLLMPVSVSDVDGDDDDDDDDKEADEDKKPLGDLKTLIDKFRARKIHFVEGELDRYPDNDDNDDDMKQKDEPNDFQLRILTESMMKLYKELREVLIENKEIVSDTYPERKRLCALIDTREDSTDKMMLYHPNDNCNQIPNGICVPELHFANSKNCVIPLDNEYAGTLLSFSFHVEATDEIRCFMFHCGRCIRFFPQDIIDLLPMLFDDKNEANKKFPFSDEAISIAKQIKIEDAFFAKSYLSLDQKKVFPKIQRKKRQKPVKSN